MSGKAIREPVAWHGPIVTNTQQEIQQVLRDVNDGRLIQQCLTYKTCIESISD